MKFIFPKPEQWRKKIKDLIRSEATPRKISAGLALGTFISFTPFFGIQTLLSVGLSTFFKWNRVAAAAGAWVSNPLTAPFIYGICFIVGAWLTGSSACFISPADDHFWQLVWGMLPKMFWPLCVGCFVVGLPVAVLTYFVTWWLVQYYRKRISDQSVRTAGKK